MKRGTRWTENGATDHVLIELDTACHDPDGARSNFALSERGERGGPGRVPRDGDDDEGHKVNDMKTMLHHQGSGGTRRGTVSKRARGRAARVRRRADRGRGGNE
jgi:hypothetical protein